MDQGVGREVKRLREERGWSRTKLAAAADMSASGVSMIESGQRNLTTTTLAKLAGALGVEVVDLFPKAQSPLPLLDQGAPAGTSDGGAEPYALLGQILADRWRGSLREFKAAPGLQLDTLRVGDCRALMQFVWDVFETTAVYETAAEDSPYPRRPGYTAALEEMRGVRQEAADTIRPILKHLEAERDNIEFLKIWDANGLDAMMSKAGIR